MAQNVQLPDRISITDKFFSPWGTNLFYEYELEKNEDDYIVQRTAFEENGKKKNRKKQIGSIDSGLIEKVLNEISENPNNEINPKDFQEYFPMDSIHMFFKNHGDNYWINNDYQRQFITEQLTEPANLTSNLEAYFRNYDHSGYIDGSSTEVDIKFHFTDSTLSIKSKSILWCGLPIEINGQKNFSPNLAALIGEFIPDSKTERKEQFSCNKLFAAITRETINNHRRIIDNLESKTYQIFLDSISTFFNVSYPHIEGSYTINWEGERRLSCLLRNNSMPENVSISYSNPIKEESLKYSVSEIISDSERLIIQLQKTESLNNFITANPTRKITIIYDGNSSFSPKAKERALEHCESLTRNIDLSKAIFFELRDEYDHFSRWLVTENGKYFCWWGGSNPPSIEDKSNYLKCE